MQPTNAERLGLVPFFNGSYAIKQDAIRGDTHFNRNTRTWHVPPFKEFYSVGDDQFMLRLDVGDSEALWIGDHRGKSSNEKCFGAFVNKDLLKAAMRGSFSKAIVPPLVAAARGLWEKEIHQVGFLFAIRMGEIEWNDIFDLWYRSDKNGCKSGYFNCYNLPSATEKGITVFPDNEKVSGTICYADQHTLVHSLVGPGNHLRARFLHDSLGIIHSDMQKGPTAIADGILMADVADENMSARQLDAPHIISVMNGIIQPVKIKEK